MELSPQLLTSVTFREQWRGYNPEEVDDLLERVAVAVGELQQRLRDTTDRASEAEHKLLQRDDEDQVRRTLVLAQRTATQAVEEARADAERIVAAAEATAAEREQAAEQRVASIDGELAERERRELATLVEQRRTLEAEIEALAAFLEDRRQVLRSELGAVLASLDGDAWAAVSPPPMEALPVLSPPAAPSGPVTEIDLPAFMQPPAVGVDESVIDDPHGDVPAIDEPEVDVEVDPTGEVDAVAWQPPYESAPEPSAEVADVPEPDDAPRVSWADEDPELDPFLAELRRAVTDTEPLGPRDHDPSENITLTDEADDGGGRFRLRRNRS